MTFGLHGSPDPFHQEKWVKDDLVHRSQKSLESQQWQTSQGQELKLTSRRKIFKARQIQGVKHRGSGKSKENPEMENYQSIKITEKNGD